MAKTSGKSGLVKLSQRNAEKLSRLLGNTGGGAGPGNPFRDSSFSRIRLAQAPSGGIPARTGITPGSATCTQVLVAGVAGTGYTAGDLVKTTHTFTVLNFDTIAHGVDGDRIIQVSNWADGSWLVGSSCVNTNNAALIVLYEP